ncbi:hypothetical protein O181_101273, partial [Austropuccinia psidii MF-1]|nr:hypothetical protein [Austropuccinia psidii MF-1]
FKEIKDVGEDVAISSLHLFQGDMDLPTLSFHASLEEQWDEEEEPEEIETVLKVVPPSYHKYLDVFSEVKAEKLPPHHACDHHIELEGLLPPIVVIYSLSNKESETLWAYISENVEKGFIGPSSSSTGVPVLFVKKKDGGLFLCVDYRKLNAVTRKNRYPVPPMKKLLTIFNSSTIFSKIDLHGACNLLRIIEGDERLTAFRAKYGSYEYLVMPFGLTNALASFQNLVNDIFAEFLDVFVVVCLDDITIFSSSEEEHVKHLTSVFQRLREKNLFAKASKCVFHDSSVGYLGYIASSEGLKMDSSKAQQILNWPQPRNIKALQSFLGFANFYPCFIKNYSYKLTSLTSLVKKDSPFIFNEEALSQFQILREAFTTAPILAHFNPSLPAIVETNASDYALGAVLSQVNDSGKHPIAFDSRKLLPAKLNYETHDKELLGIFWALKFCRASLLFHSNPFEVLTDHSSLQYFMYSKFLTYSQARWAEFLSEFHFTITYHPGRLSTLPDSLSRWDDMYPERGVVFISKNPQNFYQIQKEVWQENDNKELLNKLARGESVPDYSLEPQAKLLLFKDRVVIPSNEEIQLNILQKHHDSPLGGHPGQEKTLKLIKRNFYWAGMNQFIKDYVSSSQQCSRNKNIHHKKFGLLKPLSIPSGPWNSLSMDFITKLPLSNNFDSILVVVDRFSKMEIFIPAYGTITSLDLAQIFISHVFSKHGLPVSIVSDRGSLFVSSFWNQLCQQLKISRDLLTAFHPETDGQTERVNQILEL